MEDFTDSTLKKKEMVVLENKTWSSLDYLIIKKTTADSESKGKNTGYTCDQHGQ